MNVLSFTGNLGSDARVNEVSGTPVCNFSVAMRSGFGDKEQTHWVDVALWGARAAGGLPGYLLKGQQVAVSGELSTREYEGKTYLTVRANSVDLIGGKGEGSANTAPPQAQQQASPAQATPDGDSFDSDIPF